MSDSLNDYSDLPNKLFLKVSSSNLSLNYKSSLDKAMSNELWEFSVTVIWKFVILFFYEKLYQIFLLGQLHEDFQKSLDVRRKDCHTCFSFNCLEDDYIFQKMDYIWRNVDANYKNIFRRLLDERNSLSHVNEYPYSETQFKAYAENSLILIDYLQKLHLQLNFEAICQYIQTNNSFACLSTLELNEIMKNGTIDTDLLVFMASIIPLGQIQDNLIVKIKEEAIRQFVSADSFAESRVKGLKLIKPLVPYFNKDDYVQILTILIEKENGQVLHASGIEDVFLIMYFESTNNHPELDIMWKKFLKAIKKVGASNYFSQLILQVKEKKVREINKIDHV